MKNLRHGIETRIGDLVGLGEIARHDLHALCHPLGVQGTREAAETRRDALTPGLLVGGAHQADPFGIGFRHQGAVQDSTADEPCRTCQKNSTHSTRSKDCTSGRTFRQPKDS